MIDVKHQINEVRREVGRKVLEAGEARVTVISQTYKGSLDDVWDACTNPDRIRRWFLPVSGDLKEGGHYQLEGQAGGTIQRCNAPHGFSATWEYAGEVSWIELRLSAEANGRTRFELEHIAHVDDERWTQYGPGAVGVGWDLGLIGLGRILESPENAIDPAEGMAWTMSDDGKRFISLSSDLWGQASAAAGEDPSRARAAAARTTAFYTGAPDPTAAS